METPPLLQAPARFAQRNAAGLKLLLVGFLILVLLAPLGMVRSTLHERLERHDAAVADIAQSWGGAQRLLGPVLVVPFTFATESETVMADGRRVRTSRLVTAEAFFLPDQLTVNGDLEPSARSRGIYTTHVYGAKLRVTGRFAAPDFAFTNLASPEVQWSRARVGFALSDLRGTREALVLKWSGGDAALEPGARIDGFGAGLHAPVKLAAGGGAVEFSLELTLNGSGGLTIVPLGRQTDVRLASAWPDPGFVGSFLPVRREIGPKGFNATWQVSHYGRDFPQAWATAGSVPAPTASAIEAAAFGVNLVHMVTAYRTVERAIKYGVLFLALVFTTFFLFEALSEVRLSALNYLLVGAALCLFYLGLLSLSEFVGFTVAYGLAAGASVLLIGLYGRSVLRSARRALLVCGMLGGVYAYLYFVLRMEDFALLAGTGALFVLLAAVMYATRRLDRGAPPAEMADAAGVVP
ncbi:MAG TPA: cell envelope integrity protein CreD [Opitutaceae bacterium]|nr:cell envelope integrity protein CreD [Opitutaceae bacterium]